MKLEDQSTLCLWAMGFGLVGFVLGMTGFILVLLNMYGVLA